jgi:hypothetical protein
MACKMYWVFNDQSPCSGHCDPAYAIDNDSVWRCNCGSWPVLDAEPTGEMAERFAAIAARLSPPPVKPLFPDLPYSFDDGAALWGDIMLDEAEAEFAALSTEQQAQAQAAARKAAADMALAAAAAERRVFAQIAIQRLKSQPAAGKLAEPCKFLYVANGGKEPDSRSICSECWRHEFVNPQTGKKETPHACNRLHPGEAGWKEEWSMLPLPRNRFRIQHAPQAQAQAQGVRFFPGGNNGRTGGRQNRW